MGHPIKLMSIQNSNQKNHFWTSEFWNYYYYKLCSQIEVPEHSNCRLVPSRKSLWTNSIWTKNLSSIWNSLQQLPTIQFHQTNTVSCYFQIRQLRSIRRSLTIEYCHALVRAMVLSRLDYCNGLLGGVPKSLLGQLSGVMRAAARLILVLPRQSHVTSEIRVRLHWLDMPSRVEFSF